MNYIKKNTPQKKKIEKKFTNSKNWTKWSTRKFFGQKHLSGKQTWPKKVKKFGPSNYIKKRINYPRKKYIRFVYYSRKTLRWKKIFVRRYHRRLHRRVKMNRRYKWRYFWRRRKIKKRLRFWHNFTFVLKKQNPINVLKFNRKKKWVGRRKRRVLKLLPKRLPKRKLSVKARDTFKKKIYFKKFLIKYYNFKKVYQLKNIYRWAKHIPGNNIINFFLSLESQLSSVCVRMHFFWTVKSARTWINLGLIYVNGRLINFPRHVIEIGDLISILVYKLTWSWTYDFWFGSWRRKKFNRYLNGSELSYRCASAILFYLPYKIEDIKIMLKKRRKHWLKTRVFSFLVNSFY